MCLYLGTYYQIPCIDFFWVSFWRQHLVWRAFIELGSGERGRISLLLPPMAAKGAAPRTIAIRVMVISQIPGCSGSFPTAREGSNIKSNSTQWLPPDATLLDESKTGANTGERTSPFLTVIRPRHDWQSPFPCLGVPACQGGGGGSLYILGRSLDHIA